MNWEDEEQQAVALRLLLLGQTRVTKAAAALIIELEELGLAIPGRRQAEFHLPARQIEKLRRYLAVRWPRFAEAEGMFAQQPEAVTAAALRALRRPRHQLPPETTCLNRKTWSAHAGGHSKSGYRTAPEDVLITTDEVLRLRASSGLCFIGDDGATFSADACQGMFGEVAVPERGLAHDWQMAGTLPKLVITVENVGAYVDLTVPSWVLLLHAPGRNTYLAAKFMDRVPAQVPWVHFGDVDPAGLNIALSLRSPILSRQPVPWIPHVATALVETHSLPLPAPWPERPLPSDLQRHPVLQWLRLRQRWLEHETIVLLPELQGEIIELEKRLRLS